MLCTYRRRPPPLPPAPTRTRQGKGPKVPQELRTPRRARNYAPELRTPVTSVTFERNVAGTTWRPQLCSKVAGGDARTARCVSRLTLAFPPLYSARNSGSKSYGRHACPQLCTNVADMRGVRNSCVTPVANSYGQHHSCPQLLEYVHQRCGRHCRP